MICGTRYSIRKLPARTLEITVETLHSTKGFRSKHVYRRKVSREEYAAARSMFIPNEHVGWPHGRKASSAFGPFQPLQVCP